jgi:hypothetical protein
MTVFLGQVSQYMITIMPSGAPPSALAVDFPDSTVRMIAFTAVVPAGSPGVWYGGSGSTLYATIYFIQSGKPVPESEDMGALGQSGAGLILNPSKTPGWSFNLFTSNDDYAAIVDLLRNTSPVWFSFLDPNTWSLYCDNQSVRQDQIASALTSTVALSPALVAGLNRRGINLVSH